MRIFLCRDSIEGILSGVYDAWASRLGHGNVRLVLAGVGDMELFAEYEEVMPDRGKADKVLRTLRRRLCLEDFEAVYRAVLSADQEKADSIYRFIVLALHSERRILDNLEHPAIHHVFRMNRKTANEANRYLEFVRFRELYNGALFSEISPESQVLPLIGEHFANRLPLEHFLIYDNRHKLCLVHAAGKPWVLAEADHIEELEKIRLSEEESEIEKSWQAFFDGIAIPERKNKALQQQFLPLKFRAYMTEKI